MDIADELSALIYNLSYHAFEFGRYIVNFMVSRGWRDGYDEHRNGHAADPNKCYFCRYDRDVIEPRVARRERDIQRMQRALRALPNHREVNDGAGRDEVDGGYISQ
jgi:hypothetical protein